MTNPAHPLAVGALLLPLTIDEINRALADRVLERVRDRVAAQNSPDGGRHCMRVTTLPDAVMRLVVQTLAHENSEHMEAVLLLGHRQPATTDWQVSATRLIEMRNANEPRPLIAFIPPGLKAAAEDSFDVSTFVEIDMRDLPGLIASDLLEGSVRGIVEYVAKHKSLDDEARMRYALTLTRNKHPKAPLEAWAGAALYQLGLIPDFDLLSGDWEQRIQRNLAALKVLQDTTQTLLGRIHSLKLADNTLQIPLYTFLKTQPIGDVRAWGEQIATDAAHRGLAIDRWEFIGEVESEHVVIVLDDLDLPPQIPQPGFSANMLYFDVNRETGFSVKWETDPKPLIAKERGLDYFRVSLVDASDEPVWQSKNIKVGTSNRAARSFKLQKKDFVDLIEDGVYYIRVHAYDASGEPITIAEPRDPAHPDGKKSNESEDVYFWVDPNGEPPPAEPQRSVRVSGFIEARLGAQGAALARGADPAKIYLQSARTGWAGEKKTKNTEAVYNFVYDAQTRYTLSMSALLRRIESDHILGDTASLGRWYLDLSSGAPDRAVPQLRAGLSSAPRGFREARADLFSLIQGENRDGLVALADLLALETPIMQYCGAYYDWLAEAGADAIDIDVIEVVLPTDDRRRTVALLMAPTHPLRLLWQLQRARLAENWVTRAHDEGLANVLSLRDKQSAATYLFRSLSPLNLIPLLWLHDRSYIEMDALTPFWGAYLDADERDIRAVRQRISKLLSVPRQTDISLEDEAAALFIRLKRYLELHPYLSTLTINAFNVGDGAALVSALLKLEAWRAAPHNALPPLNYRLQLFSHDGAQLSIVGEAVELLVNPERQVSDEADVFTIRSANPLFPKLRYSRNTLRDFRKDPQRFEADVALCHNLFATKVDFAHLSPWRSSYVYGLIQEANTSFDYQHETGCYVWSHAVTANEVQGFNSDDRASGLIAMLMESIAAAQVDQAGMEGGVRPVVMLELNAADMSLIDQMHAHANWVILIDRHIGLDYFDHTPDASRHNYLLDYAPSLDNQSVSRLLVSTRMIDSIARKIAAPTKAIDAVNNGWFTEEVRHRCLHRLRAINGRLAYKSLARDNDPREDRSRPAVVALADLWFASETHSASMLVIPLDAHPDLFGHADARNIAQPTLLYVMCETDARRITMTMVQAHWFDNTVRPLDSQERRQVMEESFRTAYDQVMRVFVFDPDLAALTHAAAQKRMITLLVHYVERARRYDRLSQNEANALRAFVETLDAPFNLDVRAIGVLVDPTARGTKRDVVHDALTFVTIGHDVAQALLTGQPLLAEHDRGQPKPRQRPARVPSPLPPTAPATQMPTIPMPVETVTTQSAEAFIEETSTLHGVQSGIEADVSATIPTLPAFDMLIGGEGETPQYGVLGMTATGGRRVAIDLNTTNTICLFGAQGSGKSYTVGSIVEMATQSFDQVSVLPAPLATVIFHYHESQDYPPEFVSMQQPNNTKSEVSRLIEQYGAAPGRLNDIVLLTPIDKVAKRQAEFPGIHVQPIMFSSAELSVDSWRFLMGTGNNNSVYLKTINMIMRQIRHNITFDTLSEQVEQAALSPQQLASAHLRLQFAQQFIDDAHLLGEIIQPGRLVIVDLRDELIDKQEALGLFVVMLKIFADAGKGAFNKLVVFDEAHKYMNDDALSDSILSAIRQMRHQGVSLLIASQDPASLPNQIIELASMLVMHRFNAPSWLAHLRKSIAALKQLDPAKLAALKTGQAYVWAARASDPRWTTEPRLMQMRPRLTAHGGETRTAAEPYSR